MAMLTGSLLAYCLEEVVFCPFSDAGQCLCRVLWRAGQGPLAVWPCLWALGNPSAASGDESFMKAGFPSLQLGTGFAGGVDLVFLFVFKSTIAF